MKKFSWRQHYRWRFACLPMWQPSASAPAPRDQPYAQAGDMIKAEGARHGLDITAVTDTGGTWGNIQLSSGPVRCNHRPASTASPISCAPSRRTPPSSSPIADSATLNFFTHSCGKNSGVDDIGDLENDPKKYSIALGERGSGAWLIWQNFIAEDLDSR